MKVFLAFLSYQALNTHIFDNLVACTAAERRLPSSQDSSSIRFRESESNVHSKYGHDSFEYLGNRNWRPLIIHSRSRNPNGWSGTRETRASNGINRSSLIGTELYHGHFHEERRQARGETQSPDFYLLLNSWSNVRFVFQRLLFFSFRLMFDSFLRRSSQE